jgi:hypothetical protein
MKPRWRRHTASSPIDSAMTFDIAPIMVARSAASKSGRSTPASLARFTTDSSTHTLNPDRLADTLWRLYSERTEAEAVINAMAA